MMYELSGVAPNDAVTICGGKVASGTGKVLAVTFCIVSISRITPETVQKEEVRGGYDQRQTIASERHSQGRESQAESLARVVHQIDQSKRIARGSGSREITEMRDDQELSTRRNR